MYNFNLNLGLVYILMYCNFAFSLYLNQGAYEDLTIKIADTVPGDDCQTLITNLKNSLTESSQYLFDALDGRAYFRTVQIILPNSWPDICAQGPIGPSPGDKSDVSVVLQGPTNSGIYTQQSAGCGQRGDQIYLTSETLRDAQNLGRLFVKEFAKYRYGVFDEHGFNEDAVYPMCYKENEDEPMKVTSCSDMLVHDNGICTNSKIFNVSDLVEDNARSSIMFAAEAPSVKIFCDEGIHDRSAPTKHNFMCERRSTLDVILQNPDFFGIAMKDSKGITNTTPTFVVKKETLTRYVMVIEDSKEMMIRESWTYLRSAIRKWTVFDLPQNTEVGLVLANETKATKVVDITPLLNSQVASNIPYIPGDTRAAACLQCAIQDSIEMLKSRAKTHGAANSIIILIAPGMEYSQQVPELAREAKSAKIKIATVNYPGVFRQQMLDSVALETGGVAYTVNEKRHNMDTSLLTTYFQLTNVMTSIMREFYQGNPLDLPIEIHRRELFDDGRNSVTGSFVLTPDLAEPARFALFTHNIDLPLIKSLTLWSPSLQQYQAKNENLYSVKIITIATTLNETGTWTYKIERFPGNPQPHFIQVTATPKTVSAEVVQTRFWTGDYQGVVVLYTEVKKGMRPVMGAKVEATVSKAESNGTSIHREIFELLDSGNGDPDITKGDGIYTRYFNAAGAGIYTFNVVVTDNGNTAYSEISDEIVPNCCGNFVQKLKVEPLSAFQRVLTPLVQFISASSLQVSASQAIGRVGDLKAQNQVDQRVKLVWSAPDMGGKNVQKYEIRYGASIRDITEKFETNAKIWEHNYPFPQSIGSETTLTLNLMLEPGLLEKALFFAIKSFEGQNSGKVSNWVRVLVPKPIISTTETILRETVMSWPLDNHKSDVINVKPRTAGLDLSLQLILPIVFGVILLVIIIFAYCYCCVFRRKLADHQKADKLNTITILPATSQQNQQNDAFTSEIDHHTIGVPIYTENYPENYPENDEKKRHSIVQQQEQQLIDELKHSNISVISATLQRNPRILSPYESWTASQLLHEHERRVSPIMDQMDEMDQNVDDYIVAPPVQNIHDYIVAPPVPPLPAYNGYPVNYNIYGIHQQQQQQQQQIYHRNDPIQFNPSLQGSMSSVNSGEKKRRNVTMV